MSKAFKTGELTVGNEGWLISEDANSQTLFSTHVQFQNDDGIIWGDETSIKITGIVEDETGFNVDNLDFELICF